MKQATFGEYDANTPDFPGVSRDEWGPKAHRPVPIEEAERSALQAWLHARGFNLDCIHEAAGYIESSHSDYHPADERESWEVSGSLVCDDDRRRDLEALVSEDLAGLTEYRDPREWCDKRSPIHRHNGARVDAPAVGGQADD